MAACEKKPQVDRRTWWPWLALLLVVIGSAAIRWRLASMPLERDEGEYAYIAQQMLQGVPPYESAYSMKLPGIYFIYALSLAAFGQTITAIRLGLIIFNAATIIIIFLLTKRLFGEIASVAAGAFYAILSVIGATLGMTANAEHFVLLPSLLGILLIVKHSKNRSISFVFWPALLFGLAFIIKQHGIFFAVFGALYLLCSRISSRPVQWRKVFSEQLIFVAGVTVPFALVCLYYWQAGLFSKFWFWTVTYAHTYSAMRTPADGLKSFMSNSEQIFVALPLIWLLALAGLGAVFARKNNRCFAVFIVGFLVFSFLAVCPGLYFRPHYFLFICPAAAVLAGVGFGELKKLSAKFLTASLNNIVVALVVLAIIGDCFYQHWYLYKLSPEGISRLVYPGRPFNESLRIAEYIKDNSSPEDSVAVLGSEPQIYFYSNRRSATRYIYMYPLMESHDYAKIMQQEMIAEIESERPKFIVYVDSRTSWLCKADSKNNIFIWLERYSQEFYNIAGIVEMHPGGRTLYKWDDLSSVDTPILRNTITIYKRK
jgi:4-amino-4-deoxy-L-arabinose transferase-like glycosyltransferase